MIPIPLMDLVAVNSTQEHQDIVDSLTKSFEDLCGGKSEDYSDAARKFVKLRRDATEQGSRNWKAMTA